MIAYLEKINGEWLDDFVYMSWYHLYNKGYEIITFDDLSIKNGKHFQYTKSKYDVIVGSVESAMAFFDAYGIKTPAYLGYPDELSPFLYRNVQKTKWKDVKNHPYPYFIKPADDVKLFTGDVITDQRLFDTFDKFYPVDDEMNVYVSDVIPIISEYRCFVHRGKLAGIQWYKGDFTVFPNANEIQKMIMSWKDAPVAYSLDVGVSQINDTTKTVLVEVNDFWTLGSYGLPGEIYTKLLVDRFKEILA